MAQHLAMPVLPSTLHRVGLEQTDGEVILTLREFNAKYDKFDWCEDLSQNASKNATETLTLEKRTKQVPRLSEVVNALTKQTMAKELLMSVKNVSTFQR